MIVIFIEYYGILGASTRNLFMQFHIIGLN